MNNREDTHLLSGVYALDAVTPDEAALIEAAMRDSEELRNEIVGLCDTAVALGLAVAPVEPPPALRARLLDAIEDLPQQRADPEADPTETFDAAPILAMPVGSHQAPHRRRRARRPAMYLALAAAAVVLFTGGFFVQRTLFTPPSEFQAIQTASDAHTVKAAINGGGVATVTWANSEHRTGVVLDGVTAPAGKVLQLWSMHDGQIMSAGLYEPRDGQNYTVIAGTPSVGEQLAVTVEPAGGSPKPTTPTIAVMSLGA